MFYRNRFLVGLLALGALLSGSEARAGYLEFSLGFNYSRSEYANESFSYNRRLGGSVGYNFDDSSMVEFGYQNSFERNHYEGFEDSTYRDQVYSVNFVYNILGRSSVIQPYVKLGVGQLNRDSSIYDSQGRSQIQHLDQVTGVIGAGLKLKLTTTLGVRIEGTSYLAGAKLGTWQDNFGATFGISYYY